MNIVKFKGCRRCGGDLFLERDDEGVYLSCLQCGAVFVKRVIPPLLKSKPRRIYAR